MADTVRPLAQILELLADNNTGNISPQDVRDQTVSVWNYQYNTRAELISAVAGGLVLADGAIALAGPVVYQAKAGATDIADLPGWIPFGASQLSHFNGVGDNATDATDALMAWFSYSGEMYGEIGDFVIAEDGPNSGGVIAYIARSMRLRMHPDCNIIAGTNLDNPMLRLKPLKSAYEAGARISLDIEGGFFNQIGQKNSTSVPFAADYPPANTGSSAVAEALFIDGELDISGTPTAGFNSVRIVGVRGTATTTKHWQSAGGDSAIFVGGTKHIHVSDCEFEGSRDLAIYASGLSSGQTEGGTCYIGENTFNGCMFGCSTKRFISNVQMVNNIGYNTAVIATSTDVTASGDNVLISGNIAHGAWNCVRVTDGVGIKVSNNQSYKHGHLLEGGVVPSTVFINNNGCVRLEGASQSEASGNRVVDLNTGITFSSPAVRLNGNAEKNKCFDNSADSVSSVIIEESGLADFNEFWDNRGRTLTLDDVSVDGASSFNRDGPLYEDNTNQDFNPSGTTVIKTYAIKAGTMRETDTLSICMTGEKAGTNGLVRLGIGIGGATAFFSNTDPTDEGGFDLRANLLFENTTSTQRLTGQFSLDTASRALNNAIGKNFNTTDIDVSIYLLMSTSDVLTVNSFSLRVLG